jgi:hypothetical protein
VEGRPVTALPARQYAAAPPPPRNVALVFRSDLPHFLMDVARELRSRFGAAVHGYCSTKEQLRFYREADSDGVLATLTCANPLVDALEDELPARDAVVAEARRNEDMLGVTYHWFAIGNRHFGRGYALAGTGHPGSRIADSVTGDKLLHAYNRFVSFWRGEIDAKSIDLVLANANEIAVIARSLGVPYRGLFGARHKNLHYWGDDEFRGSTRVWQRYRELEARGETGAEDLLEPYMLAQVNRERTRQLMTLPQLVRLGATQIARRIYWRLRGYDKAKGYYLGDELRLFARRYADWQRLNGRMCVPLAALKDRPYVFYALQTEPETQIHQTSPEHFFQLEAIASLSRDLPAGVALAVKETPFGIGRRPPQFYRQIASLANVTMLKIDEPGFAVVEGARAVAVIVGTTGHEAALLGKPVISFGRHNLYCGLPHVFTVTDQAQLRGALRRALDPRFDADGARRAGRRFLRAIVETSFDMETYTYHEKTAYTQSAVQRCVDSLIASLGGGASGSGIEAVRRAAGGAASIG